MGRKIIDLTGQVINGIVVNGLVEEQGGAGKHKRWYCTCPICKEIFIVSSQHLRDKDKPISMCVNCRRKQFNDLSGRQFGRLTVLSRDWNAKTKRIRYICQCKCGAIISVQENHLVEGKIQSCGCLTSSGEEYIATLLSKCDIKFEKQKTFNGCKNKKLLPFDFYIPSMNTVIEYQGIQHFEPIEFFGGEIALQDLKKRDKIKKEYCISHCINYVAISYKENIDIALRNILSNEDIVYPHGNMVG
jgi:hypothetical protein